MNKQSRKTFLERSQTIIYLVEDSILVGLLLVMIVMSVLQIVLRDFFGGGIVWSEVLVRVLVLWVGLIGAMVASRQGNHINIDIMNRYLSGRVKIVVKFVVELFTAFICMVVAY
jgi:TRAP-type C4-dicarboxylate transport system permease small subunit